MRASVYEQVRARACMHVPALICARLRARASACARASVRAYVCTGELARACVCVHVRERVRE